MLTAQIDRQKILLAKLSKGFLRGKKELMLTCATAALEGKKAVIILPSDIIRIFRETMVSGEQLRESFKRHLAELQTEENQAICFSAKLDVADNSKKRTLVIIDKAKLGQILQKTKQTNLKVEGFLPEQLVLHKLLANEIAGDEKRLILNIGKEESRIYLLDRLGPVGVLSETISTSKLIPETQKLLKESPTIEKACSLGVFFGEKSLAFDQRVFEDQTGIKLMAAHKALFARLNKAEITLSRKEFAKSDSSFVQPGAQKYGSRNAATDLRVDEILNRFVAAAAAAILFNNKEIIKPEQVDSGFERQKSVIAKPKLQAFVVKEKKFPPIRPILISFGVAFIVAGSILGLLRLRGDDVLPGRVATPATVPTQVQPLPTTTPTPTPAVSPQDVKVRVLNGSGITGNAGRIAEALRAKSFVVVEIGNAESFDFAETEIRYKKNAQAKVNLVIESLKEQKIATPEASLDLEDAVDVEVVIGHE